MSLTLEHFHPRHAHSPIAFTPTDQALLIPCAPEPILLVHKDVKFAANHPATIAEANSANATSNDPISMYRTK